MQEKTLSDESQAGVVAGRYAGQIGERFAVGQQQGRTASDVQRAECGNERGDPCFGDQPAIQQTYEHADHESQKNRKDHRGKVLGSAKCDSLGDDIACNHAAQPGYRADRKVDAAGQHDEGHADRKDRGYRDMFGENG